MRGAAMRAAALAAIALALAAGCASTPAGPGEAVVKALAPTGKLRVGLYQGSPTSMVKDASGETRGVSHDLGRELARRLGVPFEPVVYPNNAKLLDAAKAGEVDVVFTNATPARAAFLDFTPTVLDVEQGYLVPAGSPIASAAEVDRAGIRVGVSQGSTSQGVLSRELKQAEVVPVGSIKAAGDMMSGGALHAFATNKAILFEMGDGLPGSKVLQGRWGLEHFALGVPKGRNAAVPYLEQFVAVARREGVVDRAVQRAGLRGTVAP
jgi:polar amino acid transport system substrate-binding protein